MPSGKGTQMDFDITKASSKLSVLDLKITSGNLGIDVLWFRVMLCSVDNVIERHFNQFFKRMEGYPPGVFRNNVR